MKFDVKHAAFIVMSAGNEYRKGDLQADRKGWSMRC